MSGLTDWRPEDEEFWNSRGKRIASRNLWISIPNLLLGFAIWMFWSIVIVQIQRLHDASAALFPFADWNGGEPLTGDAYRALLYTLPAVAGLAGATLRIPNSFMIALSGGRNVIALTTVLLCIPTLGVGIALRDPSTPFWLMLILAALSGVGGGAFASSMSNISFFFPKRVQGTALGLNAGLGNLGVSVMQFLLPWVATLALFGALSGEPHSAVTAAIGDKPAGEITLWVQNCGLVWLPILILAAIVAWFGMNNLPQHNVGNTVVACGRFLWLELLGFVAAGVGVLMILTNWGDFPELGKIFLIMIVVIPVTLALMRFLTPKATRENLGKQFAIFKNKHNWIMTWLYVMTFGSFIGYSAAFPKLIADVFGYVRVDEQGNALAVAIKNPNAPDALALAWLGPLVGSLVRPVGGWLSDKLGGARVTQWDTVVMIGAAIGVGLCVESARSSANPDEIFPLFLALFLLLFITTGIGNGSTFRMVPIIFKPEQAGPVLGWTSAVAAYGAFLIPNIFGAQIKAGNPEFALYGFAGYYVTCLVVNWWFYARKNAEIPC